MAACARGLSQAAAEAGQAVRGALLGGQLLRLLAQRSAAGGAADGAAVAGSVEQSLRQLAGCWKLQSPGEVVAALEEVRGVLWRWLALRFCLCSVR